MASAPAREIRVLLVDDSDSARNMLVEVLATCSGIRIAGQAADGLTGLALAGELQPDLVITDLHLPGRNGFELTGLLRQRYPSMRSVIVSDHDAPTYRAASRLHGADAFVSKWHLLQELPGLVTGLFPAVGEGKTQPHDT
jgi:DNA-binding NarL/FixJ family response regulator